MKSYIYVDTVSLDDRENYGKFMISNPISVKSGSYLLTFKMTIKNTILARQVQLILGVNKSYENQIPKEVVEDQILDCHT